MLLLLLFFLFSYQTLHGVDAFNWARSSSRAFRGIAPLRVSSNTVEKVEVAAGRNPTPSAATTPTVAAQRPSTILIFREDTDFDDPEDESPTQPEKQPLLFLPDLDGVGNYSAGSVRKLSVFFDAWKMSISGLPAGYWGYVTSVQQGDEVADHRLAHCPAPPPYVPCCTLVTDPQYPAGNPTL
jgi:hypothetical protein